LLVSGFFPGLDSLPLLPEHFIFSFPCGCLRVPSFEIMSFGPRFFAFFLLCKFFFFFFLLLAPPLNCICPCFCNFRFPFPPFPLIFFCVPPVLITLLSPVNYKRRSCAIGFPPLLVCRCPLQPTACVSPSPVPPPCSWPSLPQTRPSFLRPCPRTSPHIFSLKSSFPPLSPPLWPLFSPVTPGVFFACIFTRFFCTAF